MDVRTEFQFFDSQVNLQFPTTHKMKHTGSDYRMVTVHGFSPTQLLFLTVTSGARTHV